jgi:hypothetical protein
MEGCGVVLLGQFSMVRVRPAVISMTASKIVAIPRSAVAALRQRFVIGNLIALPAKMAVCCPASFWEATAVSCPSFGCHLRLSISG